MELNPPPPFAVFGCKVKGKEEAENLFFVAEVWSAICRGANLAARASLPHPILKKDDSIPPVG